MSELPSGEAAARRARLRATVIGVEASCGGLCLLLPAVEPWHGVASVAFRLRIAGLRDRVDAALDALAVLRAEL